MYLTDLVKGISYTCERDIAGVQISSVVYDSRKIEKDCLYICVAGANFDGHSAAKEAQEKGAAAILVEKEVEADPEQIYVLQVESTRYAMAFVAAAYWGHPAEKLKTIGVTGTKGKTTTTYLVKSILEGAGHKVGLVGTIEIMDGVNVIASKNTTPESYLLQEYFAKMVENGCDCVVMEVSSQGLMMHRTQGFTFDYGIFTNLEPDHIGPNEHKDFADYLHCKSLLFKQCKVGILNGDDQHCLEIQKGHTCEIETFGFQPENDLRVKSYALFQEKGSLGVTFETEGLLNYSVKANIPGRFSIYNVLTAMAICRHFAIPEHVVLEAVAKAKVKGRIEMIPVSEDFSLMIDYAHNAMALKSLLTTLREYLGQTTAKETKGRLISVFGCGGNRDKNRRYEMGEVSGQLADLTIITSDNPRFEEPLAIMEDIRTGIQKTQGEYLMIENRKEAIAYAIAHGEKGDIIVLAGKGHEDYQEIQGVKYPMDERVLIQEILKEQM